MTEEVIAGNRPAGVCPPDGTHLWMGRRYEDGVWTFTTYNGWLATSTTTTDNPEVAHMIVDRYVLGVGR